MKDEEQKRKHNYEVIPCGEKDECYHCINCGLRLEKKENLPKDWLEGTCTHLEPTKAGKEECMCACHENKLKKPYAHDTKCCGAMNGYLESELRKSAEGWDRESIKNELRKALRWPEGMDVLAPDMDSRSSLDRATDFILQLRAAEYERGKKDGERKFQEEFKFSYPEVRKSERKQAIQDAIAAVEEWKKDSFAGVEILEDKLKALLPPEN